MQPIRWSRAIGGLLAVVVLLALLTAHVLVDGITVGSTTVGVLLLLIGALLGLDRLVERFTDISIEVTGGGEDDD